MKKISLIIIALFLSLSMISLSHAAKSVLCEVKSIDGDTVVLECKNADKVKPGSNVKVKKMQKINGC